MCSVVARNAVRAAMATKTERVMADAKKAGTALKKVSSRLFVLFAILSLLSCGNTVFHEFRKLGGGEWHVGDTLVFDSPSLPASHNGYSMRAELRSAASYAYKELFMRVEFVDSCGAPFLVDTVACSVYDNEGRRLGTSAGLLYQHSSDPLFIDSLPDGGFSVRLAHVMECGTLSGVADVGIRIAYGLE